MLRRTTVGLGELPRDDQTLRQVKLLVRYKYSTDAKVTARWCNPTDKSAGAIAEWDDKTRVGQR